MNYLFNDNVRVAHHGFVELCIIQSNGKRDILTFGYFCLFLLGLYLDRLLSERALECRRKLNIYLNGIVRSLASHMPSLSYTLLARKQGVVLSKNFV